MIRLTVLINWTRQSQCRVWLFQQSSCLKIANFWIETAAIWWFDVRVWTRDTARQTPHFNQRNRICWSTWLVCVGDKVEGRYFLNKVQVSKYGINDTGQRKFSDSILTLHRWLVHLPQNEITESTFINEFNSSKSSAKSKRIVFSTKFIFHLIESTKWTKYGSVSSRRCIGG